jgi:hypothetical protein
MLQISHRGGLPSVAERSSVIIFEFIIFSIAHLVLLYCYRPF